MKNYLEKELYDLLKINSNIFEFIQNNALDGLWYWDLENPEEEWMNNRFWEVLGYDPNEMPQKSSAWQSIIFEEDLKQAQEKFIQHCEDPNCAYDMVVRYRHKKGKTTWIRCKGIAIRDDNNKPVRMLGAHIDITQEKEKEAILERCNSAANIGYWEVNLETFTPYWSAITKVIHDVDPDYVPEFDKAINFFKEGEHREIIKKAVDIAIKEGKSYETEVIIITAKGYERWVKAIGFAEISQGKCIRLYGTFQDIDERKRVELETASLLSITQDQNKRLQNFTHIVSHNLRSHSGNMDFMIDLLSQEKPELLELEIFQLLKEASNNLGETINHLNEVAMVTDTDQSKLELLPLKLFVDKAVTNVSGLAYEAQVEIINKVEQSEMVLGVPAYLESIIFNFLTNAIKYKSVDRTSFVKLYTKTIENGISLWIEDNGLGIDLIRHREKLFGMYKTFHQHNDSRGIGLFITKNQIEAMNGTVEVESIVDKGTIFKINFRNEKS